MQRDDCTWFEESLLSEAEIGDDLRAHALSCPRCRALSEIASLRAPRVESLDDDPQFASVLVSVRAIVAARAAQYERRRRLIPLLIGLVGYLLGALGLAVAVLVPAESADVPAGGIPLPSVTFALPPPDPAAVLIACAVSLAWVTGMVLIAGRRQTEDNGLTT